LTSSCVVSSLAVATMGGGASIASARSTQRLPDLPVVFITTTGTTTGTASNVRMAQAARMRGKWGEGGFLGCCCAGFTGASPGTPSMSGEAMAGCVYAAAAWLRCQRPTVALGLQLNHNGLELPWRAPVGARATPGRPDVSGEVHWRPLCASTRVLHDTCNGPRELTREIEAMGLWR
jgi:hypothetical protein